MTSANFQLHTKSRKVTVEVALLILKERQIAKNTQDRHTEGMEDILQDKVDIRRKREFLIVSAGVVALRAARRGVAAVGKGKPPTVKAKDTHTYTLHTSVDRRYKNLCVILIRPQINNFVLRKLSVKISCIRIFRIKNLV